MNSNNSRKRKNNNQKDAGKANKFQKNVRGQKAKRDNGSGQSQGQGQLQLTEGTSVNPKRAKPSTENNAFTLIELAPEELAIAFGTCKTFNDQLNLFSKAISFNREKIDVAFQEIKEELGRVLAKNNFSQYQLEPFGSYLTNLMQTGSDIDIFLCNIDINVLNSKERRKYAQNCVARITKALRLFSYDFVNVQPISTARVPIIKFRHQQTNISIDVNFSEYIGVCNCKLIKTLLQYDWKLQKAMMILKYWAKSHEFVGQCKLSNYLMNVLFIFYLQVKKYVPTVYQFQNTKDLCLKYIDGWLVAYRTPTCFVGNAVPDIENLLKGFFDYFADFDFISNVISPYVGKVVKRSEFADQSSIPSEFLYYKKNMSSCNPLNLNVFLCVQDFFIHNRCIVPIQTEDHYFWSFLDNLQEAKQIFEMKSLTQVLPSLFANKPSKVRSTTTSFNFRLSTKLLLLSKQFNYSISETCNAFKAILGDILQDIFCMNCEIIDSKFLRDNQMQIVTNCSILFNIWSSRKQTKTNIRNINQYDYEKYLSAFLIKNNSRKLKPFIKVEIVFDLRINQLKLAVDIKLCESFSERKSELLNFFLFFKSKLPELITYYFIHKLY